MRAARLFLVGLVGLSLPVGLALAVYLTSAGALASSEPLARVPTGTLAQPSTPPPARTTTTDDGPRGSDRCGEPEHRLDPECTRTRTVGDDRDDAGPVDGTRGDDSGSSDSGRGRGRSGDGDEADTSGSRRGRGRGRSGSGGDD